MNANEFIEQQLDERLRDLEGTLNSAVSAFVGNIVGGVDVCVVSNSGTIWASKLVDT